MGINTENYKSQTKPSTYGVSVSTWGTTHGDKTGYWNEIKALLGYGELGTQHARITITIPNNEEGRKLVEQYCKNPPIPYEFKKRVVKEAVQNKHGKWVAGDKVAFEEDAIVINFSWCTRRNEGEVPYTIPGYSGDSYIKGMKLKMDWNSLKWSKKDKRFVWKNKKVKTLHPKIHHIDRIIQNAVQNLISKLEKYMKSSKLNPEMKKKLRQAIDTIQGLANEEVLVDKNFITNVVKKLENLQTKIYENLENVLGEELIKELKISKTPIQDIIKKHSKDTSAEEEMMMIGSGLAPSHEVRLPIMEIGTQNPQNGFGALDAASMLKTMHGIAKKGTEEKAGWTVSRNCSETARQILFSGVTHGDKELERVFRNRVAITSPQKLLNWALRYQKLITEKIKESFKPVYDLFKSRQRSDAVIEQTEKDEKPYVFSKQYQISKDPFVAELTSKIKNPALKPTRKR